MADELTQSGIYTKMKNKARKLALLGASAIAAGTTSASAAITTEDATEAITAATTHAETIGIAGFAIAAVWLIVRVIKKGIRSAA